MLLKKGFAFYYLLKDNLLEEPFSFFIKCITFLEICLEKVTCSLSILICFKKCDMATMAEVPSVNASRF